MALDEFLVKNDPCRGKRSLYHLLGPRRNQEGDAGISFFLFIFSIFGVLYTLPKYLLIVWVLTIYLFELASLFYFSRILKITSIKG